MEDLRGLLRIFAKTLPALFGYLYVCLITFYGIDTHEFAHNAKGACFVLIMKNDGKSALKDSICAIGMTRCRTPRWRSDGPYRSFPSVAGRHVL